MMTTTLTADAAWQAITSNDRSMDDHFVYAVVTTGVYCRPSCTSRRPLRKNVELYPLPEAAAAAGYRPCRRCRPAVRNAEDAAVSLARRVCALIANQAGEAAPTLASLAAACDVSPSHLQRTFKRIVGISPRRYAEALRVGRLRLALAQGTSVTHAMYDAGYGAPSRLYETAGETLGMTPSTYARGGRGAEIEYALSDTSLGLLLVAATERGICFVALGDDREQLIADLHSEYPEALVTRGVSGVNDGLEAAVSAVVERLEGHQPHADLPVDVQATAFQWQVWERLRQIPRGETRSYSEIATELGMPGAARAVGSACASNPVAVVVPCHRVINANGDTGAYRWGAGRKRELLAREGAVSR